MSKEGNGETRKVVIELKESPDYRVVAANGAWGGLTPKGDIMMGLFIEHGKSPLTVTHDVEDGKLGPEVSRDTDGATISRTLQVGVLMSPTTATTVANWLLEKVETFNSQRETLETPKEEPSDG